MQDKDTLQKYVNNFRRSIAPFLKPGIGLECNIYPSQNAGAIVEFSIGEGKQNNDIFKPLATTINSSLQNIPQQAISGNFSAMHFSGTNTVMEPGRILLIKGEENSSDWNDQAAKTDVNRILSGTGVIHL